MPTVNKITTLDVAVALADGGKQCVRRVRMKTTTSWRLRPGVSLNEAQADVDRIVSIMKQHIRLLSAAMASQSRGAVVAQVWVRSAAHC